MYRCDRARQQPHVKADLDRNDVAGTLNPDHDKSFASIPSDEERSLHLVSLDVCGSYDIVHRLTLLALRWGELHVCSVGEVVGPPYSLESVAPGSGAITGATKCTVRIVSIAFREFEKRISLEGG